jgi:hypothetical protein
MARRGKKRTPRRVPTARPRTQSYRSHWRADGAPKSAYRSQGEALSVADERRQESGVVLMAYRCDFCSFWHLGNTGDPPG